VKSIGHRNTTFQAPWKLWWLISANSLPRSRLTAAVSLNSGKRSPTVNIDWVLSFFLLGASTALAALPELFMVGGGESYQFLITIMLIGRDYQGRGLAAPPARDQCTQAERRAKNHAQPRS